MIDTVVVRALGDVRFREELERHPVWVYQRFHLTSEERDALRRLLERRQKGNRRS
jgi:hypothetical protein